MNKQSIIIGIVFISGTLILSTSINFSSGQNSTSSTEVIQWKTYTDPEGKFNINYPADWKIDEIEKTTFDKRDVGFIKKETVDLSGGTSVEQNAAVFGISYNTDSDMEDVDLEEFVQELSSRNQFNYDNYREIEGGIDTYKISGNPAVGIIFANSNGFQEQGQLNVISFPDDNLFNINYVADQKNFDKYLPIAEKMIQSIKIIK